MAEDENNLFVMKKEYLEQHTEFVYQTLQKTRGTEHEKLWKQMYNCITTNVKMSRESIRKLHAKIVDLKQKSKQKSNVNSHQPSTSTKSNKCDKNAAKGSVSPIRFPNSVKTVSDSITTTIIYQKTTSIECSSNRYVDRSERAEDSRLRSIGHDAESAKKMWLVKSRGNSRDNRDRYFEERDHKSRSRSRKRHYDGRNRNEGHRWSKSRSSSISPSRNHSSRNHHVYENDDRYFDSRESSQSWNLIKSNQRSRSSRRDSSHPESHRSSRDGSRGRRREAITSSHHSHERYESSHRGEKRREKELVLEKVPTRNLEIQTSLRSSHPHDKKQDVETAIQRAPVQSICHNTAGKVSRDDNLSSISISSDEELFDHHKKVRVETHTTHQHKSYMEITPKYHQRESMTTASSSTQSKNFCQNSIKEKANEQETSRNETVTRQRSSEEQKQLIDQPNPSRIFDDFTTFDRNLDAKNKWNVDSSQSKLDSRTSEPEPRSAPPRRRSCFQAKLELQSSSNQSCRQQQELSTSMLSFGKREDPRSRPNYCNKKEETIQKHSKETSPKPAGTVSKFAAMKKRRMSCYQPQEPMRPNKARRLSADQSPKKTKESPYRIPKLSNSKNNQLEPGCSNEPTTSHSKLFDDKKVFSKLKTFAEKDLSKSEEKPENLVSKLQEVLGEDFLKIRSLLIAESDLEQKEPKKSEAEKELTKPETNQSKIKLDLPTLLSPQQSKSVPRLSIDVKRLNSEEIKKKTENIPVKIPKNESKNEKPEDKNLLVKKTVKSNLKPEVPSTTKTSKTSNEDAISKKGENSSTSKSTSGSVKTLEKVSPKIQAKRRQTTNTTSKDEEVKTVEVKKKKTNELDRLHSSINKMYDRDDIFSYKPRSCRVVTETQEPKEVEVKKAKTDDSLDDKTFKLKSLEVRIVRIDLTGLSGTIHLNRAFLLKNPSLSSVLKDIVDKQEDEEAEDEICERNISASEDSSQEVSVIVEEPKPMKVVPPAKISPAGSKSVKKRSTWYNGTLPKKAKKTKKKEVEPEGPADEWEEIETKVPRKKIVKKTRMKLSELTKLMKNFKRVNENVVNDKNIEASTFPAKEKETQSATLPANIVEESQSKAKSVSDHEKDQSKNLLTEVQSSSNVTTVQEKSTAASEQPASKTSYRYSESRILDLQERLDKINDKLVNVGVGQKKKKVCVIANQNISFNSEKKLKCELCFYESSNTDEFVSHLQRKHPLNLWSQHCNICKKNIEDSNQSLASELGHLLSHMTYSVAQHVDATKTTSSLKPTKPFLKVRQLPGDKLSSPSPSPQPNLLYSKTVSPLSTPLPKSSDLMAFITVKAGSLKSLPSNNFTQSFHVKIPSKDEVSASMPSSKKDEMLKKNESHSIASVSSVALLNANIRPWIDNRSKKTLEACREMLQSEKCLAASYKCMGSNCTFYSDDKKIFKSHLILHEKFQKDDMPNVLSCSYCESVNASIEDYFRHIDEKHGFNIYQCGLCFFRSFNEASIFKQHHQKFHRETTPRIIEIKPLFKKSTAAELEVIKSKNMSSFVPKLKCFICREKAFYIVKDFVEHLAAHPGNNVFQCTQCKQVSPKMSTLKHFYDCFKLGSYQCVYCIFGTQSLAEIGDHVALCHSSHFPYFCERVKSTIRSGKAPNDPDNEMTIRQIYMKFPASAKKIKMLDENLTNAENVNRLNDNFIAEVIQREPSNASIIVIDDDDDPIEEADRSQFSIIPLEETEAPSTTSAACQIQIQNVTSLFEMPTEKFIGDDLDDLELYDFDC